MQDLSQQRCYHHRLREAAARCTGCGRYICRECITEHEDRVLCTSCLNKLQRDKTLVKMRLTSLMHVFLMVFSFIILWLFFYTMGQALLSIPSSFHEGTIWNTKFLSDK